MDQRAAKLLDEAAMKRYLAEKVLPMYPHFRAIRKIKVLPRKKLVWEKSYHLVIEYRTQFVGQDARLHTLPIYCSAHSHESRQNVFDSLKFLWENKFSQGFLTIPHPLFFDGELGGIFYRGVEGENLYHYIRGNDRPEIENIVPRAARWFAKLHRIRTERNFNPENSRIETVLPGTGHILERIRRDYAAAYPAIERIYDSLLKKEKDYFDSSKRLYLIHGDAHPENIIRMGKKKLAVIDFTDLCLGDFARDLGSFIQQMDYMMMRKIADQSFADKMKEAFLETYFRARKIRPDEALDRRIALYYDWTAMRTAVHFLMKHEPEAQRAEALIEQVEKNLNHNNQRTIIKQ